MMEIHKIVRTMLEHLEDLAAPQTIAADSNIAHSLGRGEKSVLIIRGGVGLRWGKIRPRC